MDNSLSLSLSLCPLVSSVDVTRVTAGSRCARMIIRERMSSTAKEPQSHTLFKLTSIPPIKKKKKLSSTSILTHSVKCEPLNLSRSARSRQQTARPRGRVRPSSVSVCAAPRALLNNTSFARQNFKAQHRRRKRRWLGWEEVRTPQTMEVRNRWLSDGSHSVTAMANTSVFICPPARTFPSASLGNDTRPPR